MSSFAALALVIGTLFVTNVIAVWTMDNCTTRAGHVISGVENGLPLSTEYRRLLIFQNILPAMANVAFLDFLGAAVMFGAVWSAGSDAGIQWIGYLAAFWNGVAGLQWLLLGGVGVLYLRSVVEDA